LTRASVSRLRLTDRFASACRPCGHTLPHFDIIAIDILPRDLDGPSVVLRLEIVAFDNVTGVVEYVTPDGRAQVRPSLSA
jgi:hypothetical protein